MLFKSSRYIPDIPGWSKDLEKSLSYYTDSHRLRMDGGKPYLKQMRYADDTYCEIGRFYNRDRTMDLLLGIIIVFFTLLSSGAFLGVGLQDILGKYSSTMGGVIFIMIAFVMIPTIFFIFIKNYLIRSLMLPEDIPVRFNRKTGKVYVYDPQLNKRYTIFPWRVLMKYREPDIKVFDWQNIGGIFRRKGVAIELWMVVCKPGTTEVIDYFLVTDHPAIYDEWLWILEYMGNERELSYKSYIQPRHWVHGLNKRFAPLIIWPEGVDKASKAQSLSELAVIEKQYDLAEKMYPEYILNEKEQGKR